MKHTIIKIARKSLLSKHGPTRLMRILSSTKIGRYAIRSLFFLYIKLNKAKGYPKNIDMSHKEIQTYRIQTLVERLRKAGL